MIKLDRVTCVSIDCYYYGASVASLKKSMAQCDFKRVIFFTDIPIKIEGVEVIQIPTIFSKPKYSQFVIKELWKYIETDFVLITQHDGWVLRGESWDDMFYNYDGIGSAWLYTDQRNNFNGGFCMMSKKLLNVLGTDDAIEIVSPDDEIIGRLYRNYLIEKHGIIFPDDDTCDKFAFELRCPIYNTFGFHGKFHAPFMPTVVIRRQAALGDCVQTEKVMQYFHDKGYRVVLDTLPQFHLLFLNHYFKVHRLQEIDGRVLKTARIVNLDMSYESNPKQLHLKSYFEYAGVSEEEYLPYLKNPQLNLGFPLNKDTKLFKKYCILHLDRRTGGRNIDGINWDLVCEFLKSKGYDVIVVGKGEHPIVKGAVEINCTNENFLSYVVGGADLMIGIDSGVSHIASGFGVPCVIFFGSVNPEYIHPDLSNITVITRHNEKIPVCEKAYCWHTVVGCEGVECYIDNKLPPCIVFNHDNFIEKLEQCVS